MIRREVSAGYRTEVHFIGTVEEVRQAIAAELSRYPPATWGTWVVSQAPRRDGEHAFISRSAGPP